MQINFKQTHCYLLIPLLWSVTKYSVSAQVTPQTMKQVKNTTLPKNVREKTQKDKNEIKLNEEAIRLIQFDFTSQESNNEHEMLEAPIDKKWMKFKEDFSLPRSFTDTTKVKKIEGYVRAEPYTIWTRFGENPVYDVLPNVDKKWEIHWTINPFKDINEEYGRTLVPAPGKGYLSVNSMAGPGVGFEVDIDKFIYENLTKKGRLLKHNRKHANAWKIYKEYQPTAADSAKFPHFYKKMDAIKVNTPILLVYQSNSLESDSTSKEVITDSAKFDSVFHIAADSRPIMHKETLDSLATPIQDEMTGGMQRKVHELPASKASSIQHEVPSRFEQYIKCQQRLELQRREEAKEKRKARRNAYDIGKEIRKLKESQE